MMKERRGITLIALVITIVVLLILAGVSIAMLTGDNGILNQAKLAKEESEKAEKIEKETLTNYEDYMVEHLSDIKVEKVKDENPGTLEGEGTQENPYVINSIEDLVVFSDNVRKGNLYEGKNIILGLSLDFNSNNSYVDPLRKDYKEYGYDGELKNLLTTKGGFYPIGTIEDINISENYFKGIFDGKHKNIYNLYQNFDNSDITAIYGLFGTNGGTIKNLNIINAELKSQTSDMYVLHGGIAGRNKGNIEECSTTGEIKHNTNGEKGSYIGGIVGQNFGIIEKSYNKINIYTKSENLKKVTLSSGGIAGENYGNIANCYNIGEIKADLDNINSLYLSGIGSGNIVQCYNIGKIEKIRKIEDFENRQKVYVSGIGGRINKSNYNCGNINVETGNAGYATGIGPIINNANCTFEDCYNSGKITALNKKILVGALTGWTTNVKILNSKWLKGSANVGIANKGENVEDGSVMVESISDMPTILSVVGNEFAEDIKNINDGYPVLKWQNN